MDIDERWNGELLASGRKECLQRKNVLYGSIQTVSAKRSNGDWLSAYGKQDTVYSYEYVLYYESEDDAMPAFIRINGEGLKDAIVPVKDFRGVEYGQTVPAPYDGLVDRTSYTDGTVTK